MILPSKKISGLLIVTAFLFCATTSAFGLAYNTLYVEDGVSDLYTLDSSTGAADFVGSIGIPNVTDIAFSGAALYGITFTSLISIDPYTGAGTFVGDFGTEYGDMNALVTDDNGVLYAAGATGNFLTIDPTSGTGTFIGNYGVGDGGSSGDLAFVDDTLYASVWKSSDDKQDYLATINLATGAASNIWGLGYRDVFGLGYKDHTLYGATAAGQLLEIDTDNRLVSPIGSLNETSQWGMTVSPVPEPATILLMFTGLGAVGLTRLRKRSKK